MRNFLREHWRERRGGYLLGFIVLGLGIALGVLGSELLSVSQRTDLLDYLNGIAASGSSRGAAFHTAVTGDVKEIILLYLAGVTLIGFPVLIGTVAVRGFTLGFSLGFLLREFGPRALGLGVVGVLPGILVLPAVLLWAAGGLRLLLLVVRAELGRQPALARRAFGEYHRTALFGAAAFLLAALLRDYLLSRTYGALAALFH